MTRRLELVFGHFLWNQRKGKEEYLEKLERVRRHAAFAWKAKTDRIPLGDLTVVYSLVHHRQRAAPNNGFRSNARGREDREGAHRA